MIKICGVLKAVSVKEFAWGVVAKLQVVDTSGGDYAPNHYIDDNSCRSWHDLKGQQVEIPVRAEVNGKFLNLKVLDSVDPKKCVIGLKAAA